MVEKFLDIYASEKCIFRFFLDNKHYSKVSEVINYRLKCINICRLYNQLRIVSFFLSRQLIAVSINCPLLFIRLGALGITRFLAPHNCFIDSYAQNIEEYGCLHNSYLIHYKLNNYKSHYSTFGLDIGLI